MPPICSCRDDRLLPSRKDAVCSRRVTPGNDADAFMLCQRVIFETRARYRAGAARSVVLLIIV